MAIRLTKKNSVIFAVVIVILCGSLGYLVWRVNQTAQLSPEDSDAGATVPSGCSSSATVAYSANCLDWYAEPGKTAECINNRSGCCGNMVQNGCVRCQCCNGQWVVGSEATGCSSLCSNNGGYGSCDDVPVIKCTCQSWSNGCGVNCKFPAGVQEEVNKKAQGTCTAWIAMCNVSDGSYTIQEYKPGHPCYGKKDECKNPYAEDICAPANSCDGGSWITKPTGNINYESDISFSAKAKDSDGIKKSSIVVKMGDTTLPVCTTGTAVDCITLVESSTETAISGNLSTANKRLSPGNYTISMSWQDSKGVTSATCALSTSFTVLPKQTNPNWQITKSVVEKCIDENTQEPKSELTYTIIVKNTGDGTGTISKIEDVLDTKVNSNFIQTSTITPPGQYSDGKIVWSYTSNPLSFTAGQARSYIYKVVIVKDSFDTYSNVVTLTPIGSDNVIATANITADCEIAPPPEEPVPEGEVPQTGIFDTTLGKMILGLGLIILGVGVYNVPNSTFKIEERQYKYRDRYEKKVANR